MSTRRNFFKQAGAALAALAGVVALPKAEPVPAVEAEAAEWEVSTAPVHWFTLGADGTIYAGGEFTSVGAASSYLAGVGFEWTAVPAEEDDGLFFDPKKPYIRAVTTGRRA